MAQGTIDEVINNAGLKRNVISIIFHTKWIVRSNIMYYLAQILKKLEYYSSTSSITLVQ